MIQTSDGQRAKNNTPVEIFFADQPDRLAKDRPAAENATPRRRRYECDAVAAHWLQGAQARTRWEMRLEPPRLRGLTWSTFRGTPVASQ
ncbi:hypothetical protein [Streptomyces sp. 12257]|uniref:hypothetical protein n=1 Tax=Streptomyces sp. 12257 TaxID=3041009 RepID=UPI000A93D03D